MRKGEGGGGGDNDRSMVEGREGFVSYTTYYFYTFIHFHD